MMAAIALSLPLLGRRSGLVSKSAHFAACAGRRLSHFGRADIVTILKRLEMAVRHGGLFDC